MLTTKVEILLTQIRDLTVKCQDLQMASLLALKKEAREEK